MALKIRIRERFNKKNDVTLFHGNCVELLRVIPSETVQLIVTSPPYNVGKEYEKNATIEEYLKLQREVIHECIRITKPGGSIAMRPYGRMAPARYFGAWALSAGQCVATA